jgi:hypothetical protein
MGEKMNRVRLEKIPANLQKSYNIGPEVEAEVSEEVYGGSFEFKNKDGLSVVVDAVELSGSGIEVVRINA